MKLLFVHGWGFDGSLWDAARGLLPDHDSELVDLGYFGNARTVTKEGPVLGIGHSFGALWLAQSMGPALAGLVTINGFDAFVGDDRLERRSIDRMIARFADEPAEVLSEFRDRCGAGPCERGDWALLSEDLERLRDGRASPLDCPVIALQGTDDPIFPARLHANAFANWPDVERVDVQGQGHLLPLTAPRACADAIRRLHDRVVG